MSLVLTVGYLLGCVDGGGTPPPDFTSISATPSTAKSGDTITITFSASEELSGQPTVTVDGNPATYVSSSGLDYTYTYTVQGTETEGAVVIAVSGESLEGNAFSGTGGATLDFTAPVVAVDSLLTGDTTPALTGTVDDPAAAVSITVDGQVSPATNRGNGTWALADGTLAALAEGIYDVRVTATDAAGNMASDATADELRIDPTPPAGTVVTAGTATATTAPVTWVAATDSVTPQAGLVYRGYRSTAEFADTSSATLAFTSAPGATNEIFTGLSSETTYRLAVVAVDEVGNEEVLSAGNKIVAMTACLPSLSVWAWGDNECGRLGDSTTTTTSTPVQVLGPEGNGYLTGVAAIVAGGAHTVALSDDGTVWAWGYNYGGRLGSGTTVDWSTTPVQVVGSGGSGYLTGVTAVACGDRHTVALKDDDTVWAWGSNSDGQLGDGTTGGWSPTPVQVVGPGGTGYLTGATAIAAGDRHTVAIRDDGTVWAWGWSGWGQLGDGTKTDSLTPVQVVGPGGSGYLTGITKIAAGSAHTVALKHDGTVWAWGQNISGQLGDGTTTERSVPIVVVGPGGSGYLTGVTAITAGSSHSVAIRDDGTVRAWGQNTSGQLGDGTTTERSTPIVVLGPGGSGYLSGVTGTAAGGLHTVAVRDDGTVWAWGGNDWGQLGDGTETDSLSPVQVIGPGGSGYLTAVTGIAAGCLHTLALRP